ncbi:hypothetical protein A2U01_0022290, partial [Trifolium medium]|nr:hypothetical protein [Trifolium medium]
MELIEPKAVAVRVER